MRSLSEGFCLQEFSKPAECSVSYAIACIAALAVVYLEEREQRSSLGCKRLCGRRSAESLVCLLAERNGRKGEGWLLCHRLATPCAC